MWGNPIFIVYTHHNVGMNLFPAILEFALPQLSQCSPHTANTNALMFQSHSHSSTMVTFNFSCIKLCSWSSYSASDCTDCIFHVTYKAMGLYWLVGQEVGFVEPSISLDTGYTPINTSTLDPKQPNTMCSTDKSVCTSTYMSIPMPPCQECMCHWYTSQHLLRTPLLCDDRFWWRCGKPVEVASLQWWVGLPTLLQEKWHVHADVKVPLSCVEWSVIIYTTWWIFP